MASLAVWASLLHTATASSLRVKWWCCVLTGQLA